MLDRLPEIINPLVFAERRTELKGKLKLSTLTRLNHLLLDDSGNVEVALFFNKQGRQSFIDGTAKSALVVQCQNCLESVELAIAADIKLGLIITLEQADELPENYEPLLVSDDKMLLKDIVEDELLLALPAFPKHPYACIQLKTNLESAAPEIKPIRSENPFAVLANLKITGDK